MNFDEAIKFIEEQKKLFEAERLFQHEVIIGIGECETEADADANYKAYINRGIMEQSTFYTDDAITSLRRLKCSIDCLNKIQTERANETDK